MQAAQRIKLRMCIDMTVQMCSGGEMGPPALRHPPGPHRLACRLPACTLLLLLLPLLLLLLLLLRLLLLLFRG